jgi:hypothetical protein
VKLRRAGLSVPKNAKDLPRVIVNRCVAIPIPVDPNTPTGVQPPNGQKVAPAQVIQKGKGAIANQ